MVGGSITNITNTLIILGIITFVYVLAMGLIVHSVRRTKKEDDSETKTVAKAETKIIESLKPVFCSSCGSKTIPKIVEDKKVDKFTEDISNKTLLVCSVCNSVLGEKNG